MGAYWFVIGAQADYHFADTHGNHNPPGVNNGVLGLVARETLTDQWAVGGRIDWLALPSLLTYFSAGLHRSALRPPEDFTN